MLLGALCIDIPKCSNCSTCVLSELTPNCVFVVTALCPRSLSRFHVDVAFGSAEDYALCPLGAACLGSYCLSLGASPLPYPLLPDIVPLGFLFTARIAILLF